MRKIYNVVTVKLNRTIEGLRETKEDPLYAFDLQVNSVRIQGGSLVVTDSGKNIVFMAKLKDIEYIHTELMPD